MTSPAGTRPALKWSLLCAGLLLLALVRGSTGANLPAHSKVSQPQQQQQQQQKQLPHEGRQQQAPHQSPPAPPPPPPAPAQQHQPAADQGPPQEPPTQLAMAMQQHHLQAQQQQQQQHQHGLYTRALFRSHPPAPPSMAASATAAHHGQYVRDAKDALFHDVIASLSSDDEDFGDSAYHLLNELRRHEAASAASSGRAVAANSPPMAPAASSFPFPYAWPPASAAGGAATSAYGGATGRQQSAGAHAPAKPTEQPGGGGGAGEGTARPLADDAAAAETPPQLRPFEELFSTMAMPRLVPFFGYAAPATPVFVPLPFFVSPEMFYAASGADAADAAAAAYSSAADEGHLEGAGQSYFAPSAQDLYEDNYMARAAGNGRRPAGGGHHQRNSPIYYVRMPPRPPTTTPLMFLPGLSYAAAAAGNPYLTSSPFGAAAAAPLLPFQSPLPSNFRSYSAIYNLPVNFVANGKPTNIFQVAHDPTIISGGGGSVGGGGSGVGASSYPHFANYGGSPFAAQSSTGFASAGPHHSSFVRPTRPSSFSIAGSAIAPPSQDSKLLSLKRPYYFNGRPDDIYILPNNFNPLYTDSGYY